MSDPRADRGAYLDQVAAGLRLPAASQADVLEELDDHIAESVAGLRVAGLSAELAEREALGRLGDPGELAEGIRSARQTRRRLLLATGYGVWAAVGGAFWGWLFAFGVVLLSVMISSLLVTTLISQLHISVSGWDTWSGALTIPYAIFASVYAGRSVPSAVAARADRRVRDVARPVAAVGGGILAILSVGMVRLPLDPATVVVLLIVPIGFAVGALTARDGEALGRRVRIRGRWIVGLVVLSTLAWTASGIATLRINTEANQTGSDADFAVIGPPASNVLGEAGVGGSSSWVDGQLYDRALTIKPADALSGWRELRLEAWPAADDHDLAVDPAASAPVVIAPLEVHDGSWSGRLQTPVAKIQDWFVVATTGVAPDGRRYVIGAPDGLIRTQPWVGTVWEWLTTP